MKDFEDRHSIETATDDEAFETAGEEEDEEEDEEVKSQLTTTTTATATTTITTGTTTTTTTTETATPARHYHQEPQEQTVQEEDDHRQDEEQPRPESQLAPSPSHGLDPRIASALIEWYHMALVKDDWAVMRKTNDWRTSTVFRKKTKSIEGEVDVLWHDHASICPGHQLLSYLTQPYVFCCCHEATCLLLFVMQG